MPMTRRTAVQAVVLTIFALSVTGCSYNTFVGQEEAIKAQWAQVENQLQRRNDLIPNLVETVKGYAAHEEGVYKDIADARSRLLAAKSPEETIQAANQQTAALGRLLAVVENYPQLRANEQFNRLMDELSGTENRIATERMRYNERIQDYNTSRRQVSGEPDREGVRVQGISVLRGACRSEAGAEGQLLALVRPPVDLPLPWERLLWSQRAPLSPWERYTLTDFRVMRLAGRHSDEIALEDIAEVRQTRSWIDRRLGTATLIVLARDDRRPPLVLPHVPRGVQLAALLSLAAAEPQLSWDAGSIAAVLSWEPRVRIAGYREAVFSVVALAAVVLLIGISLHGNTPSVSYPVDDAIYPGGVKRDPRVDRTVHDVGGVAVGAAGAGAAQGRPGVRDLRNVPRSAGARHGSLAHARGRAVAAA